MQGVSESACLLGADEENLDRPSSPGPRTKVFECPPCYFGIKRWQDIDYFSKLVLAASSELVWRMNPSSCSFSYERTTTGSIRASKLVVSADEFAV